jgi:hypothetical protein
MPIPDFLRVMLPLCMSANVENRDLASKIDSFCSVFN